MQKKVHASAQYIFVRPLSPLLQINMPCTEGPTDTNNDAALLRFVPKVTVSLSRYPHQVDRRLCGLLSPQWVDPPPSSCFQAVEFSKRFRLRREGKFLG